MADAKGFLQGLLANQLQRVLTDAELKRKQKIADEERKKDAEEWKNRFAMQSQEAQRHEETMSKREEARDERRWQRETEMLQQKQAFTQAQNQLESSLLTNQVVNEIMIGDMDRLSDKDKSDMLSTLNEKMGLNLKNEKGVIDKSLDEVIVAIGRAPQGSQFIPVIKKEISRRISDREKVDNRFFDYVEKLKNISDSKVRANSFGELSKFRDAGNVEGMAKYFTEIESKYSDGMTKKTPYDKVQSEIEKTNTEYNAALGYGNVERETMRNMLKMRLTARGIENPSIDIFNGEVIARDENGLVLKDFIQKEMNASYKKYVDALAKDPEGRTIGKFYKKVRDSVVADIKSKYEYKLQENENKIKSMIAEEELDNLPEAPDFDAEYKEGVQKAQGISKEELASIDFEAIENGDFSSAPGFALLAQRPYFKTFLQQLKNLKGK